METTTFPELANANHTKFINSLEACGCGIHMSVAEFDTMQTDALLKNITITETDEGLQSFDDSMVPRIVLFETHDGRKEAIKIKSFIQEENQSYILVDIKTQKTN